MARVKLMAFRPSHFSAGKKLRWDCETWNWELKKIIWKYGVRLQNTSKLTQPKTISGCLIWSLFIKVVDVLTWQPFVQRGDRDLFSVQPPLKQGGHLERKPSCQLVMAQWGSLVSKMQVAHTLWTGVEFAWPQGRRMARLHVWAHRETLSEDWPCSFECSVYDMCLLRGH